MYQKQHMGNTKNTYFIYIYIWMKIQGKYFISSKFLYVKSIL